MSLVKIDLRPVSRARAISTTTTPSPIVAPPHSRLRFVESKTTDNAQEPERPKGRRPSNRRLRFTKI